MAWVQVAKEIISTEESYFSNITLIQRYFLDKWLKEKVTKDAEEDCKKIFSNLIPIVELSNRKNQSPLLTPVILSNLKNIVSEESFPSAIPKVFRTHLPFLKLYTIYVNSFQDGAIFLQKLRKNNKKVQEFIKKQQSNKELAQKGLDLNDLLIQPVQRCPR
jgi:hypothetical protein